MLSAAVLGVAILGVAAGRYYFRDYFSPLSLFLVGWLVPLSLALLRLSVLQDPFTARTWLMVIGSAASFLTGVGLVVLARPTRARRLRPRELAATIDARRLRGAMVALFLLSLATFAYEVYVAGTVPILADSSARTVVYRNFPLPFVHYGTISSITVAILAFAHLWFFRRRAWVVPAALLVLSSVIIVSILARLQMLLIAFACVVVVNYTARRPLGFGRLALVGGLMLLTFLGVGLFRSGDSDHAMEISGTYLPDWAKGFVWPYLYLALNFQVLQSLSEAGLAPTYGAHTLQPLLSLTLTRRLFPLPVVEEEYGWFNTYTYLWPLYSDFGVAGTLVAPLIYGVLAAAVYGQLRRAPSVPVLITYSLVAFSLIFVFQANWFALPIVYVVAGEIWLVCAFARRRGVRGAQWRQGPHAARRAGAG